MNSAFRIPAFLILLASPLPAAPSAARQWNEQLLNAIRGTVPNPPQHARNLFHTAVAMYNAWAAYDATAVGYVYNEKFPAVGANIDVEAERQAAVSYAAHRVLRARFSSFASTFDAKLNAMGYSSATAAAPVTANLTAADLGKRIGQAILTWSAGDAFDTGSSYPQPYTSLVNPNMNVPLPVLGMNHQFQFNMQLGYGIPTGTNPNFWQPLALSSSITQNGLVIPGGVQPYLGVQGLATTPFSLTRTNSLRPWIDLHGGPSRLSLPGAPSATDTAYRQGALEVVRASSQLNDETFIDISPGVIGNNPLGTDAGAGFVVNPVTNTPYAPSPAKRGDFTRVLAEFWADGPNSETPPGHWHVLANQVADHPLLQKRLRGTGPVVSDLEWDVKMYFCVAAATHDAACAAWALKRYYSGVRPITMIRYLGDAGLLPLEQDVAAVITEKSTSPGGKHELVWDVGFNGFRPGWLYIGQIAVRSWPGEDPQNPAPSLIPAPATFQNPVCWMLAKDWLPFQRKTFNTPAFPGYISGHSTFSRAAAEALSLLTGSPYFPGGFHHYRVAADSLQIDRGPSQAVDLQWCTYFDAADQAGQSRIFGGIHVKEDDYHGRETGSLAGKSAFALAEKYWTGAILADEVTPQITLLSGGQARITWTATRGMYHRLQTSTDLGLWTDANTNALAYDTKGEWTDFSAIAGRKFYRVIRTQAGAP